MIERHLTDEQRDQIDFERRGEPVNYVERRIPNAAFDAAHVGSIKIGSMSELLLGPFTAKPQFTHAGRPLYS